MQIQKFASLISGNGRPDLQCRRCVCLLRLRGLFRCKPWFDRSVLRTGLCRRSLGRPSGSHRSRELRTTFWCKIEFSLHFFGSTWSLNRSCLHLGYLLASFTNAAGRFLSFLIHVGFRCGFKFLFQLGELLRTLLQASFQSPDFLAKILRLHNEDQYCFRRSRTRLALDIELMTKPLNVTSLFLSGSGSDRFSSENQCQKKVYKRSEP
jgi:hypothetical protein